MLLANSAERTTEVEQVAVFKRKCMCMCVCGNLAEIVEIDKLAKKEKSVKMEQGKEVKNQARTCHNSKTVCPMSLLKSRHLPPPTAIQTKVCVVKSMVVIQKRTKQLQLRFEHNILN